MSVSTSSDIVVAIGEAPIDTDALGARAGAADGALVEFRGVVRDSNEGRAVIALRYECYEEMARAEAERIATEVREEFGVGGVVLAHRVGELSVGDVALYVAVAAAHRGEAFAAVQAIVDRVKERVPIWKKERYADRPDRWL
jgi:molybdopterin synthase catalytic subunit